MLVGKIDSELNDIIEKVSTNSNKQQSVSINLEYLQKQKTKLERALQNHKQSIDEIKQRIKNYEGKKYKLENDITELSSLIDASS